MRGGRVLADGSDGCVFTEPMIPCAKGTEQGEIVNPLDVNIVSKVVKQSDTEYLYLEAANRILGNELAVKYLAGLRGYCKPADANHPPSEQQTKMYVENMESLQQWPSKKHACATLKQRYADKEDITSNHMLMFITRYPSTIDEWIRKLKSKNVSVTAILNAVNDSMPEFLLVLQKFYQNSKEQLINVDLHFGNIFVKATSNTIQFGLSDFGRCVLRQEQSDSALIHYLEKYQQYTIFSNYRQVPLEARILNYIYKKHLESESPQVIIDSFISDKDVGQYVTISNDIIVINLEIYLRHLLKKNLFIKLIEDFQSITKKMILKEFNTLTTSEKDSLWFTLTRYMAVAPIITIAEQLMDLTETKMVQAYVRRVTTEYLDGKPPPKTITGYYPILAFLTRIILAPYSSSLIAVEMADNRLFWNDILRGH
jgi:hypothetical protein